jgi:NTP pyrophosphatase (non-canonical NTP hydrolase)
MQDLSFLQTFDFYQEVAKETAGYDTHMEILYPALGLAGEAGEVANKVQEIWRDYAGVIYDSHRDAIAKELGDVLWYVAALCTDLDINMADVARKNLMDLRDRAERGTLHGDGDDR